MTDKLIRLLLVDDHQILREGLRALLGSEPDVAVVAETGTGREAIELAARCAPSVAIVDLGLPDMSGLDVIRAIRALDMDIRTVVLSMHTQKEFVLQALEAGCDGYVPKSTAHVSLTEAIRSVQAGERFIHPKAAAALAESVVRSTTEADQYRALSERERDVLRLSAQGFLNREIGEQLLLSPKTVETYRQRAMEKLGLQHRSDLVRFALRAGVLGD